MQVKSFESLDYEKKSCKAMESLADFLQEKSFQCLKT